MNIRRPISKLIPFTLSTAMLMTASPFTSSAGSSKANLKGDINTDGEVNTVDIAVAKLYISGKASISPKGFLNADMNKDGNVDSLDLTLLEKTIFPQKQQYSASQTVLPSSAHYAVTAPATTTCCTTTSVSPVTIDVEAYKRTHRATASASAQPYKTPAQTYGPFLSDEDFIIPPVMDFEGSFPTQGEAKIAMLYVDFPDCHYQWAPLSDTMYNITFGEEDPSNQNFPNESIRAFYQRTSKHSLDISGQVYRYTTEHDKEYYENNAHKRLFVNEVLDAMDDIIDYSQFDGNDDNVIDTVLINVPASAGDDEWWPSASNYYYDFDHMLDETYLSYVIIGNAEIKSSSDYANFTATYTHELGHCMGLPDYYLYQESNSEGMHGSAGYDTMDEIFSDFSCATKLLSGWYKKEQIQVYDGSASSTFELKNGQTENGNCVIIPCGELADDYLSEFFILEYTTLDENNIDIPKSYWWKNYGSGVRVIHVEATSEDNSNGKTFCYRNGNDTATNNGLGKRLVRVVNDADLDNLYHEGSVINSNIPGFGFYDEYGHEKIDPGVEIIVGSLTDDSYTITINKKG
jgi:M6 family metalloprotease-like protein